MHVLVEERIQPEARERVRHLLSGRALAWDRPPMALEPWRVFGGVSSAVAQVVRLFGKEVEFDQWGGMQRLTLATLSWEPLPYEFGWWLACRPFGGITFTDDPMAMPAERALRYLTSWPHGYLTLDELGRFVAPLRERVIDDLLRCQSALEEPPGLTRDGLEILLRSPHTLSDPQLVDLFGSWDDEELDGWQLRRALMLLRASSGALAQNKDLVAVGY